MKNLEENFNRLSKMLKKRSRDDFQLDLRNEIIRKANTLNAEATETAKAKTKAPKKKRTFAFPPLLKRSLVPVTALALLIAIGSYTLFPGGGQFEPFQLVDIAEAKDYYTLTPIEQDESGVDGSAGFRLESKGEVKAKDVEEVIQISPQVAVNVEQEDVNTVIITPEIKMATGTVYSIALDGSELDGSPYDMEYSWAYEIADTLRITGTYPGYHATKVPTNVGIEVSFNYRGVDATDFEEHFSIEPHVDGTFEVKEKTAVFIPSQVLQKETIYEVNISPGLTLENDDRQIEENYPIIFETASETTSVNHFSFYYYYYNSDIREFSTDQYPYMLLNYNEETLEEDEVPTMDLSVYRYGNSDDFLAAMQHKDDVAPSWTYYTDTNYSSSKEGLEHVMSASGIELIESNNRDVLEFPDKLPAGQYLIEMSHEGLAKEVFVQVSNIATYISLSEEAGLFWVNDTETNEPIKDATVEFVGTNLSVKTDKDGVAIVDNPYEEISTEEYAKVTVGDTTNYYDVSFYISNRSSDDYWKVLQTDRRVYHPDDTIHYSGFVKGRKRSTTGKAEIFITDTSWYSTYDSLMQSRNVYYHDEIEIEDGVMFEGSFDIEKMAPSYWKGLYLAQDGEIIASTTISIKDFIKPAYEISMETEDKYLFVDDPTTITARAQFFEGTPVPNLELNYNGKGDGVTYTTDEKGEVKWDWTASAYVCGNSSTCNLITYNTLSVNPTDPETADIHGGVRIYVARAHTYPREIEFSHQGLSLETRNVDIEGVANYYEKRENYDDIFTDLVPNTQVDINIEKREYIREETGEYYDYINKVVRKTYNYRTETTTIEESTLYTDENGKLNYPLNLDESYTHNISLKVYDSEGNYTNTKKTMTSQGKDRNFSYSTRQYLTLEGIETNYAIGDEVSLSLKMTGGDSLPTDGSNHYLFIESQDGIRDYGVNTSNAHSFEFDRTMLPNTNYKGVMFDGDHYEEQYSSSTINFNYEENARLDINIEADEEEYAPGQEVTLDLNVINRSTGKETSADVNVFMVDEAYYSLYSDRFTDPLQALYSKVYSGINYTYMSHEAEPYDPGGKGGCFVAGTKVLMADGTLRNIEDVVMGEMILTRESEFSDRLVSARVVNTFEHAVSEYLLINDFLGVTEEHVMFVNGMWTFAEDIEIGDELINSEGELVIVESIEKTVEPVMVYNIHVDEYHTYFADGIYVHNEKGGDAREDFQDTALFTVVSTDSDGKAQVTFTLPDNVTSWRLVALAINDDLEAGFSTTNIDVTLPFFVTPVLNEEYLTGDNVSYPARAYGEALQSDDAVTYGVYIGEDYAEEFEGKAFEETYLTLPELEKGELRIVTYGETEEHEDAVALTVDVEDSHFRADQIWSDYLTENMVLEGAENDRTQVTFMNGEVGAFYGFLARVAYSRDDRADEAASNRVARKLLNEYFGSTYLLEDFPTFLYQNSSGIKVLPYDDPRLELTAKLAALDASLWSDVYLNNYFTDILEDEETVLSEKILALYGLSAIDEPVLNELNFVVDNYELGLEDKIYAALAYIEFGSNSQASELYLEVMESNSEVNWDEEVIRITEEGALIDDELSWGAYMASIAAELGSQDKDWLWAYVSENDHYWDTRNRVDLVTVERMLYVKAMMDLGASPEVSFKFNGDKITLENSKTYRVNLLPDERKNAIFSGLSGDVMVSTYYRDDIDPTTLDVNDSISIDRTYYVNGMETTNFQAGEIVKVQFDVYVPTGMEGGYKITDYLPSGLKSTTARSYTQDSGTSSGYRRNPYKVLGQEMNFYTYCSDYNPCGSRSFYYYARVINTGEFVAEPAIMQKYRTPSILNISGETSTITIEE